MIIVVSSNVQDLTGIGSEFLADAQGNVIAEFFNGNFVDTTSQGNREVTIIPGIGKKIA